MRFCEYSYGSGEESILFVRHALSETKTASVQSPCRSTEGSSHHQASNCPTDDLSRQEK